MCNLLCTEYTWSHNSEYYTGHVESLIRVKNNKAIQICFRLPSLNPAPFSSMDTDQLGAGAVLHETLWALTSGPWVRLGEGLVRMVSWAPRTPPRTLIETDCLWKTTVGDWAGKGELRVCLVSLWWEGCDLKVKEFEGEGVERRDWRAWQEDGHLKN